jgi:hypothetical protein
LRAAWLCFLFFGRSATAMRFVPAPARSLCAKCRDPLLDKTLHFLLGDRLGVGFGESLPNEVGEFVFGQLAVLICVGGGKQRVEPGVGTTHRQSGQASPTPTTMAARSPFAPVVEGEKASAAETVRAEPMTGASVSSKAAMPCETLMAKPAVASHAVPRETATMAAPTVKTVSAMVTMAGPTVDCAAACVSAPCPTVLMMPAMMSMAHKVKPVPAGKPFAVAPASVGSRTGATKARVT